MQSDGRGVRPSPKSSWRPEGGVSGFFFFFCSFVWFAVFVKAFSACYSHILCLKSFCVYSAGIDRPPVALSGALANCSEHPLSTCGSLPLIVFLGALGRE